MNNNTFTTINNDMLFACNDHYPSQPLVPFSPSSYTNDILTHYTSNPLLDHHLHLIQPSHFDAVSDLTRLTSYFPENNGTDDNQTIPIPIPNHHPSLLLNTIVDQPSDTITYTEDSQRVSVSSQDPKMRKAKKPSRTDRHSKIKTARGTRDRRMRLSLDVAKKLFGLQDMLGFDKASKTVEWLLTQAKPEIIKIAKNLSHQLDFSSYNEYHTGSMDTSSDLFELASMSMVDDRGSNTNMTETSGKKVDGRSMRGKRKRKEPRTPILKELSKEERAKARVRAKDRTVEKMEIKRRSQLVQIVEEEAQNHGEMIKNNIGELNPNSFEVMQCEKQIKELFKNDRFAVYNDFVMNKKDHISNESYHILNPIMNSSFPMISQYHHSQETANSVELCTLQQQQQFTDRNHFWEKPRNLISYNSIDRDSSLASQNYYYLV